MRCLAVSVFGLVALAGCGRGIPVYFENPPPGTDLDASAPMPSCSPKILFDQATGCLNDGAFELCAPSDDGTLAKLAALAPTIVRLGTPGRLKCAAPETTYVRPLVDSVDCTAHHGAMIDATWNEVCSLAALNDVRVIGPYFAE